MDKLPRELAEQEVMDWLEKKKVLQVTIEFNKEQIDVLAGAVSEGVLTLDRNTWEWIHELLIPFDGEQSMRQLKYAPRLNDKMVRPYMTKVKPGDSMGHLNAYVCALTKQPTEVIANLDSVDKKISMAIALFFL